jgi:AcrR family transcriptional regulator
MSTREQQNSRPSLAHVRRSHASRSEETQRKILDAALRVIQAHGLQKATMTEIAREAGVSAGALQHHYGSKDILITRIIDLIFEESKPDGDICPSVTLPVRQRAYAFVERAWQSIYGTERYLASWHLHFGVHASEALRVRLNEVRLEWDKEMTTRFLLSFPELEACIPDPTGFARLVFSSLRGIAFLAWFGDASDKNLDQLNALAESISRVATGHTDEGA